MEISKEIRQLHQLFADHYYQLYPVGGCVRDSIRGETPHDIDFCTSASVEAMKYLCKKNNLKYLETGALYGTITINYKGENYEITTYRSEGAYSDGRHPDPESVRFVNNLEEDLKRRDFTINAMAYDIENNKVIDLYEGTERSGENSLKNHVLYTVGDAEKRINEDALRMLRAMRFCVKYDMKPSEELKEAIIINAPKIANVSKERITEEFRKIFTMNKPVRDVFSEECFTKLLCEIIPELEPCVGLDQNSKYHKHNVYEHMLHVTDLCDSDKFELKMAAFLHDIGKPAALTYDEEKQCNHFYGHPEISAKISEKILTEYLRPTSKEKERIVVLVENHDCPLLETKQSVKKNLNRLGEDVLRDLLVLKKADIEDHILIPNTTWIVDMKKCEEYLDEIISEQEAFSIKDLKINGNDLMDELKMKPCKEIGQMLNYLLQQVIEEKVENDRESLLNAVKEKFFEKEKSKDGPYISPYENPNLTAEECIAMATAAVKHNNALDKAELKKINFNRDNGLDI